MRFRRGLAISILLLLVSGGFIWRAVAWRSRDAEIELADARRELAAGRHDQAHRLAAETLRRHPDSSSARLVAAQAALASDRSAEAVRLVSQIPYDGQKEAAESLLLAAEILLHAGHATAAEIRFKQVLETHPETVVARARLARLLTIEGRRWEANPHWLRLLRDGNITLEGLVLLGDGRTDFESPVDWQRFQRAVPDDALPMLGAARLDFQHDRLESALATLRRIVAQNPRQIEAQVWLGRVLLRTTGTAAMADWNRTLPSEADRHPLIWLVRGLAARDGGQAQAAIRCFAEAAALDPNLDHAHQELSALLAADGQAELSERFRVRAESLRMLINQFKSVYIDRDRLTERSDAVPRLLAIATRLEGLGRAWEAMAWTNAALAFQPNSQQARSLRDQLQSVLAGNPPQTLPEHRLANSINLSMYSLPDWQSLARSGSSRPASASNVTTVQFDNLASQMGLDFTYINRLDQSREGLHIHEANGGGVAILDYDGDGWPDIYLTQGGSLAPGPVEQACLDCLFRSRRHGFLDITNAACLNDDRYGQGVAAGDFDNDGFADLYVANIGGNRLYHNAGDGTFADVSVEANVITEGWTTSCLIADVNGDSLPDLYDVNYLEGEGVHSRICQIDGHPRICPPFAFAPQADRLWINLGDGRFADASVASGMEAPGGNGLGILAADLEGHGKLSLFVANDQTANFLFVNLAERGAAPRFAERAVLAGVAFDREGRAQACMGVAAGDANGDGRLDMFVTNFQDESNTLYRQSDNGTFVDVSTEVGLAAPSLPMVGFGAQFVDADLDGWSDLIVTNGHIDDYRFRGQSYHMRPQYFHNAGDGRFVEVAPKSLGPFFEGEFLGRSMARVDWNRDGREDLVISHLDSPVALLTNRSHDVGRFLAVQLRGVTGDRDAIGAIVVASIGDRDIASQLTAGDGYQASNQRQLVFGLGPRERVDRLRIRWPAGETQEFENLPANVELLLIEGRDDPVRLPR